MNAADMKGGTMHTEMNVSASSRGFKGVRVYVCFQNSACVCVGACVC